MTKLKQPCPVIPTVLGNLPRTVPTDSPRWDLFRETGSRLSLSPLGSLHVLVDALLFPDRGRFGLVFQNQTILFSDTFRNGKTIKKIKGMNTKIRLVVS